MRHATDIPLETFKAADALLNAAQVVANHGNPNAKSDAMVAVQMAMTTLSGAYANVEINLDGTGDAAFAETTRRSLKEQLMNTGRLLGPISEALGWKGHEPPRA
jgi:formiminotetrahydrofolate cyclodeaminase